MKLSAYTDASFAADPATRQSTSGMAIFLSNALIGWKLIRQKHLSLTIAESEFSCFSHLCTELI